MITHQQNSLLRWCSCLLVIGLAIVTASAQTQAQDGGIDDGGLGGIDGGGGGGTGGAPVDFTDAANLDFGGSDEDPRNQGFVGATAPGVVENTFIGAASQTFGALAEDATFGGGVNDSEGASLPSGGGGGGIDGGGGAGGFNGATTGGSVIRSSIRTRLRPAFAAPRIPPQVLESNFYDNLSRQPSAQSLVGRYQVTIENRTATVTGFVDSQADADRLIRQLKLQPGVYGIVSRLQIAR